MKKKILSLTAAFLAFILLLTGCTDAEKMSQLNIDKYFTLTQNDDATYSYALKDKNGNILFERANESRVPDTFQVSATVLSVTMQTGTTLSTNGTVYWDVENSLCSRIFYYVLGVKDNLVVCAEYLAGEHFIIVEDMFDADDYYGKYKIKKVSNVVDFAVGCKFNDKGQAVITYLSGDDCVETEFVIDLN